MHTLGWLYFSSYVSFMEDRKRKLKNYVFGAKLSPKGSIYFLILSGLEGILRNIRH